MIVRREHEIQIKFNNSTEVTFNCQGDGSAGRQGVVIYDFKIIL